MPCAQTGDTPEAVTAPGDSHHLPIIYLGVMSFLFPATFNLRELKVLSLLTSCRETAPRLVFERERLPEVYGKAHKRSCSRSKPSFPEPMDYTRCG